MKHKILCIDDESHNLEALERLLRKKFDTVIASSGPEALEKLKIHNFSLIISDQKMPEMTGVQFFVKAKEVQPEAIRILLTGYTDLESVINAINQGQIYRYITKPWEPEEFLSITQQAIEVFEMKQTIRNQNIKLQKANDELKSLDKLKSDFMMLVNHELKTPLTGIFSYVQLLGEEKLNDEPKLYVSKIHKNTQRLQDLIDDTLLITKLKATNKPLERDGIDVRELAQNTWIQLEKEFSKKKLQLALNPENSFIQQANSKYIGIILKKLMLNSFSHAKENTTIVYSLDESEHSWTIHTKNELDKELEKSPEELLNTFNTSEKILNHSGGTGLGLAVIQSITKLFGGELLIESKDKNFSLTLSIPKM